MPDEVQPLDLLERWKNGDEVAANQLYLLYADKLIRLAESHLDHRLRRRVDGVDVVQSVFGSFFKRVERGQTHIESALPLWRLLVKMTIQRSRRNDDDETRRTRDDAAGDDACYDGDDDDDDGDFDDDDCARSNAF